MEGLVVPERMKIMQITKRHLMQLRLKLDSLKEGISKKLACNNNKMTARVFMHMSGVKKMYETRLEVLEI